MRRLLPLLLLVVGCLPKQVDPVRDVLHAFDADPTRLDALLPVDPAVHSGTLPNGVRWYVEPNQRPAGRVELRLVVLAGSVHEDDDQRGLAHYVEHMAFNGTERFPGTTLVRFLEGIGLDFGADLNATTGFDHTVYELQVPTADPQTLDTAVAVLADWVHAVRFDAAEFDAERGVVLEEWRTGQGLPDRLQQALTPLMYGDSRWSRRMPIGTEASLRAATVEQAERFWRDWYRTDRVAVIAVGDVDPADMAARIERAFGPLAAPTDPRPAPDLSIPIPPAPQALVFSDPELTATIVEYDVRVRQPNRPTFGAYREFLLEQVVERALSERLDRLALRADAPFLATGFTGGRLTPDVVSRGVVAQVPDGGAVQGLQALLTEVERVRRFGFTADEVLRARNAVLVWLQDYYEEAGQTDSAEGANEIVRVFTTDEPMPGEEMEWALGRTWLPAFDADTVSAHARAMFEPQGELLTALVPAGRASPDEGALLAALHAARAAELQPPAGVEALPPLLATLPTPGRVVAERLDGAAGAVVWTLSNGATVIVRPSVFQSDEILFGATSPGGLSRVDDADLPAALVADELVSRSGLGGLDVEQLVRWQEGRAFDVSFSIDRSTEGLIGSTALENLEQVFQTVHAGFVAPRFDPAAVGKLQAVLRESLSHKDNDPEARFSSEVNRLLWQGHPRHLPWTEEDIARIDAEDAARVWANRFGDASDFTFVFAGSVLPETLRPFVERYLASLPGAGRDDAPVDRGDRRLPGPAHFDVPVATAPRATAVLRWHGPWGDAAPDRARLIAAAQILEVRLREELREALSGTYGAGVQAGVRRGVDPGYDVIVSFDCNPARLDELEAATLATVAALRREVGASYLADFQARQAANTETAQGTNGFWLGALLTAARDGLSSAEVLAYPEAVAGLDPEAVRAAAEAALDPAQVLVFRMIAAE